jgi:hypothetical protein
VHARPLIGASRRGTIQPRGDRTAECARACNVTSSRRRGFAENGGQSMVGSGSLRHSPSAFGLRGATGLAPGQRHGRPELVDSDSSCSRGCGNRQREDDWCRNPGASDPGYRRNHSEGRASYPGARVGAAA